MHDRITEQKNSAQAHLFGLGLDNEDGHVRITKAEEFSVLGGSKDTHDKMTETACKTFEDLGKKGKRLAEVEPQELSDLLEKNTPEN